MSDNLVNEAIKAGAAPAGYQEIDVEFFKFTSPGAQIAGKLINKREVLLGKGNRCGKYTLIRDGDGKMVAFLGSVELDEKMARMPIGASIVVRFIGIEKIEGSTNEMKHFKTFVKS